MSPAVSALSPAGSAGLGSSALGSLELQAIIKLTNRHRLAPTKLRMNDRPCSLLGDLLERPARPRAITKLCEARMKSLLVPVSGADDVPASPINDPRALRREWAW
jgi:hypothetical protein